MATQVSDGLKKEVLVAGTGPKLAVGRKVTVQCTGSVAGNPPKKFWRYREYVKHRFTRKIAV